MRTTDLTAHLLFAAWIAGPGATGAQSQERARTVALGVARAAIRVDGHIDEAEWAGARTQSGFVQQRPDAGKPATLGTDSIVARLARRDAAVTSDWFWIYLDTFRDRRNAFGFGVNAAGVKRDIRIADDTREAAGRAPIPTSAPHGMISVMHPPANRLMLKLACRLGS